MQGTGSIKVRTFAWLVLLIASSESPADDDDVRDLLDEHYPHDRAKGYAAGDIRGAFSVVWPASEHRDPPQEFTPAHKHAR